MVSNVSHLRCHSTATRVRSAASGTAIAGTTAPDGTPALPGQTGSEHAALAGTSEEEAAMISLAMVEGQMRASSIAKLQDLVERHPDDALTVVRRWMVPEGA